MTSFLAGLGLIIVGLVSALFGYRLFRILLPLYGAVFGFVTAWGWWGDSAWFLALVAGIAIGIVLAFLAYGLWSAFVTVAGVVAGLALASLIATSLNLGSWLSIALGAVLALAFGLLFFKVRNPAVIFITATVGAAEVARGVGEWFGLQGGFGTALGANPGWLLILLAAVFVLVGAFGLAFQWNRYRGLDLYGDAAAQKEQAPAAAATRAAAAPVAVAAAAGAAVVAAEEPVEPEPVVASSVEPPAQAVAVPVAAVAAAAAVKESADEGVAEPAGEVAEVPVAAVAAAEAVEAPAPGAVVEAPVEVAAEAAEVPAAAVVAAGAAEALVEEPVVEAPVGAAAESAEAPVVEAPVALAAGAAAVAAVAAVEEPVADEVVAAPAEVEAPVEAAAEVVDAPAVEAAVLAAAAANKVDDVPLDAGAGEPAEVGDVDAVVRQIEETYSYDDIAKFKEKLEFVEGIGPAYAEKLVAAGINTVLDLLHRGATRKGRLELVEVTGISAKLILRWVNHADLYRIKGVGSEYADLLEVAGVDTVVELSKRNPVNLLNAMTETNKVRKLVRKEPVASQVEDWVAQAKQLPRVILY